MVARGSRQLGAQTRLTAGSEFGGDWIDSNNLGVRSFGRGSLFTELQQRVGSRLTIYPGLRYDAYSRFGDAWSPSIAARFAARPRFSLRGSVGHAFRVPTFTELYYRDPNHEARDDLEPERGWAAEAGVDLTASTRALVRATVFSRHDRDVIDWTRVTPAERWRTITSAASKPPASSWGGATCSARPAGSRPVHPAVDRRGRARRAALELRVE